MTSAHVRTLPHYMPEFRAWRPVRITILVCDSQRERVSVNVTVQNIDGRFGWPFGSHTTTIIAWKNADRVKDECVHEVTIWPRKSGKPQLLLSSPDSSFTTAIIETPETDGLSARFHSVDAKNSIDDRTYLIRRAKRLAKRAAAGLGVLGTFALLFWAIHEDKVHVAEVESVAEVIEPPAPTEIPTPHVDAQPEPVVLIPPRTDCLFVDPDREQDANGKVTVMCSGAFFQATATYLENGCFQFTDLTPTPR